MILAHKTKVRFLKVSWFEKQFFLQYRWLEYGETNDGITPIWGTLPHAKLVTK